MGIVVEHISKAYGCKKIMEATPSMILMSTKTRGSLRGGRKKTGLSWSPANSAVWMKGEKTSLGG
jgi:hypothetical protein